MGILKIGAPPMLEVEIDADRFPGWMLNLQWLAPKRMNKIREDATIKKRKRGVETEVTDQRIVSEEMCKEMIRGWKGFKADYVRAMMPLDDDVFSVIKAMPEGCLPFSEEDLRTLVEGTYSADFLDEVIALCTDHQRMQQAREKAARKNSSGSQPTVATETGPAPASNATT